jgi:prepilin-type processing-associated H-X9-DG protein
VKYPSQKIMVGCLALVRPKEATNFHWGLAGAHNIGRNNFLFVDGHSANMRDNDRQLDPHIPGYGRPWASLSWADFR